MNSANQERIDELTAEYLVQLEQGLEPDIEEICASDPELVEYVRTALRALERLQVLPKSSAETRKFGEFELLEELGRGGMGVVWRARQERLRRLVALKLMRPGLEWNERSRVRFDREVRALSQLDHPNICTVFEAGEINGRQYMAMRYVDGESLADRIAALRSERTSTGSDPTSSWRGVEEAIVVVEKIARALDVAHRAGVVHRDVKPANILIESSGEPVLVDFGLAYEDEDVDAHGEADRGRLTQSGDRLGTPTYMAPEQVRRQQVDPSTDVHALAVTLFECIALRPPFEAPDRVELYQQILNTPPPNLLKLNRAAGRDLRAVLEKALEKDSRHRFATALEFADELRRILAHEPIRTRRLGPGMRLLRWGQRNRAATAIIAIALTGLVTSLGLLRSSLRAERELRALAFLEQARRFESEDPVRSFQFAREAAELDDDPRLLAYVQEAAFRLPRSMKVREDRQSVDWAEFSPTGSHFFVSGVTSHPSIHLASNGRKLADLECELRDQRPAIAFSPNGDEIAVGTFDGSDSRVVFWNLDTKTDSGVIDFGPGDRRALSISWYRDGEETRLLVTRLDGSAILLRRRDRQVLREIPAPDHSDRHWSDWPFAGAFLPDGRFVAAEHLWNADGTWGEPLGRHERRVLYTYVAENADRFMTVEKDGAVRLFTLRGEPVHTIPPRSGRGKGLHDADLDPAGEHLVVTYLDGTVHLHGTESGALLAGWNTPQPRAVTATFSADGERVLTADWVGRVEVRMLDGTPHWSTTVHSTGIPRITADPNSQPGRDRILTAGWDGAARLTITTIPPSEVRTVIGGERPYLGSFADGSGRIALGGKDGSIVVYDSDGKELIRSEPFAEPGIEPHVRVSDGTIVATEASGGRIAVWNPFSGSEPERLETGLNDPARQLWWAERLGSDNFLLMQFQGGPLFWSGGLGDPAEFGSPPGMVPTTARASPSGAHFVAGTWEGRARLHDADGSYLDLQVPRTGPSRLAVSALGFQTEDRVALALQSGEIELWDLRTGERLQLFEGHTHPPVVLAFSRNGSLLASVSPDGVRIWNVETGASIRSFRDPAGSLVDVVWVDADTIVTSARGGFVRWWELEAQAIREAAARLPFRRLSEEELNRALGR